MNTTRGPLRRAMSWIGLALTAVLLLRLTPALLVDRVFQYDDFLEYWAASRLTFQGLNAYSADLMFAVQQSLGRVEPVMMFNPPYALALTMPFGLFPYPLSRMLWLIASIVAIAVAVTWLWELVGGPRPRLPLVWIIAFGFSAVLGALHKGQISPFMLLGLAGFLRYEGDGRPWRAGFFAALTALKPHWLLLFWVALLLWSSTRRKWKILLSACTTLVVATAVVLLLNPAILSQYFAVATQSAPMEWHTPTIGGALRGWLGPEKTWLQHVSVPLGLLWVAIYWWRHRANWQWATRMPGLVFASVITAMYGWTYDQVVLLVALVPAIHLMTLSTNPRGMTLLGIAGVVLNLVVVGVRGAVLDQAFWWVAPVWLLWYALVMRFAPGTRNASAGHLDDQTVNPVNTLERS